QKTIGIKTIATANFRDEEVLISARSDLDDRDGVPNWLLNVVGLATLNVGSKAISDNYRASLSRIKSQLVPITTEIGKQPDNPLLNFRPIDRPRFRDYNGRITLVSTRVAPSREGSACFFARGMREQ